MLLAASSDIHWKTNLKEFKENLEEIKKPDLFLLAGDLTEDGELEGIKDLNSTFDDSNYKVFACFGNEEYNEIHKDLLQFEGIKFLDDEFVEVEIKGKKVAVIGSRGSLDRPTYWQRHNVPGIRETYKRRIEKIRDMLKATSDSDFQVLFMHYSPTYKTLGDEERGRQPEMGSKQLEPILREEKPDLVIHGHAHNGKKKVKIGATSIYNVAFPLWGKIVEIDTEKLGRGRLDKF